MNNENQWDKLLKIKTSGRDDSRADQFRYPYEPTPYCVLERLANEGYIGKKNTLIDYGCGKGRVDFFLSYQARCRSIGIEYDDRIYRVAVENQKTSAAAGRVTFCMQNAEVYAVPTEADRFYFFNPFSVEILCSTWTDWKVCLGAIFVSDCPLLWYTKSNIHFSNLNGFNW